MYLGVSAFSLKPQDVKTTFVLMKLASAPVISFSPTW